MGQGYVAPNFFIFFITTMKIAELESRLKNLENELRKYSCDTGAIEGELNELKDSLNEIKQSEKVVERKPIKTHKKDLSEDAVSTLFSFLKEFYEDCFNAVVEKNYENVRFPETLNPEFEIVDSVEVQLESIEVDTTFYLNQVIQFIIDGGFIGFINSDVFKSHFVNHEFRNRIKDSEEANYIFLHTTCQLRKKLKDLRGFKDFNIPIDHTCEIFINDNNILDVRNCVVNDFYSNVIIPEFDLQIFIDDLELIYKLEEVLKK